MSPLCLLYLSDPSVASYQKGFWENNRKRFFVFTMATETLNAEIRRLTVIIFFFIKFNSLFCQQFIISFQTISDCAVGHFYDVSSLSCVKCGPNQRASVTGWLVSPH